jgi:hypothetical protein
MRLKGVSDAKRLSASSVISMMRVCPSEMERVKRSDSNFPIEFSSPYQQHRRTTIFRVGRFVGRFIGRFCAVRI